MDSTSTTESNSSRSSIEIETYPLNEKVIVGEALFQELCWAWIETKGPTLLKAVIRENELKERKIVTSKPKLYRHGKGLFNEDINK